MGGSGQPYLYDAPKKDPLDGFNPRAATEASRRPPEQKPKPTGPLVNFNQHPDSYVALPYGRTNVTPMSPKIAGTVKWMRWAQLGLRILQLIGAMGILVCVIFIRGTKDTEGWVVRIPPGADIVVCSYAIYHLIRPARHRTPASSASYHFFSLVTDAGFIPFYVFIAILANTKWNEAWGTEGRWRTFFDTESATNTVLFSTWVGAIAMGGLHLASLAMALTLVIIFRRISNMPPDMNPLERNLTARRQTKHKHKNSEITVSSISNNRNSALTASTLNLDGPGRGSMAYDPLMPDARTIPFVHTRQNSDSSFNPHSPRSANQSRRDLTKMMYQQSESERNSRVDTMDPGDDEPLSTRASYLREQVRPNSLAGSLPKPTQQPAPAARPQRSTYQPVSHNEPVDITDGRKSFGDIEFAEYDSQSEDESFQFPRHHGNQPGHPTHQRELLQQRQSLQLQRDRQIEEQQKRHSQLTSDNWFVHEERNDEQAQRQISQPKPTKPKPFERRFSFEDSDDSDSDTASQDSDPFRHEFRRPLKTNVPANNMTSPSLSDYRPPSQDQHISSHRYSGMSLSTIYSANLSETASNVTRNNSHAQDYKRNYSNTMPPLSQTDTNRSATSIYDFDSDLGSSPLRAATPKGRFYGDLKTATANLRPVSRLMNSPGSPPKMAPEPPMGKGFDGVGASPRVVSRTGVDEADLGLAVKGTWRRREVSGKVAEEGRSMLVGFAR